MVCRIARGSILALAALAWASAAGAQSQPQVHVPEQELGATQHHQPTQAEVSAREEALHGNDAAAARRAAQDQATVDRLYRELTGKSPGAPVSGSSNPSGK